MSRTGQLLIFLLLSFILNEEYYFFNRSSAEIPPDSNINLFISEVADPANNYKARFVELYNSGNTDIDLAGGGWHLCRQANGSPSSWGDIALNGVIGPKESFTVAYNSAEFQLSYGFEPNQISGFIQGNGDDGYFLYCDGNHASGTLIDSYGIIDEDGTGQPWEYLDSRSVRRLETLQASSLWNSAEWKVFFSMDEVAQNISDMSPNEHPDTETSLFINSAGRYNFNIETTGIEFNVNSISGEGNISVRKLEGRIPQSTSGIPLEDNISKYRWIIESEESIISVNTDLEIKICQIINHGISENADDITLYIRDEPGNGEFRNAGFLAYDDNGTHGYRLDDKLSIAGITTFGEFVLGSPTQILPVELLYFVSEYSEGAARLKWSTSTEINNYGFIVERSSDCIGWIELTEIAGHGNSNLPREYTYTDGSISEFGTYYYRLKQIDFNGNWIYSDIAILDFVGDSGFMLFQNYPNPFNASTKIKYVIPGGDAGSAFPTKIVMRVYDIIGNEVFTLVDDDKLPGRYVVDFDAVVLSSGVYCYMLTSGGRTFTRKMILIK